MARLRFFGDEATARIGKSLLHLQAWEGAKDAFEIARRKRLNAETPVVETDPHRAHSHLRLLVERERWRRIERDQIPDELGAAIRKFPAPDERKYRIRAIHFEAVGPRHTGGEADVVEYRADGHDLAVVGDSLPAANRFREQPRTHRVIEQVRLRDPLRILDHRCDERRVGHIDPCNQSCRRRVVIDRCVGCGGVDVCHSCLALMLFAAESESWFYKPLTGYDGGS